MSTYHLDDNLFVTPAVKCYKALALPRERAFWQSLSIKQSIRWTASSQWPNSIGEMVKISFVFTCAYTYMPTFCMHCSSLLVSGMQQKRLSYLTVYCFIHYFSFSSEWSDHFYFSLVHESCPCCWRACVFLLVSVCIHDDKTEPYLLAWCHPPHQFMAMSAASEIMQLAAAKLPPATSRTQSYRSSNTGQSKAVNKKSETTSCFS